jgi:anthrone oxygenase-like protein
MRPGLYAFAVAAAFLGATIYISLVEQPARLRLNGRAMIQEWKLSNRRGTPVLSILAVLSALIAFIQFRMSGDVRWIIGGITILASWPYAYFVMMPVNIWLFSIPLGRPVSPIRKLMRDWGLLEWGHALIGLAACCAFAWPLEMPP